MEVCVVQAAGSAQFNIEQQMSHNMVAAVFFQQFKTLRMVLFEVVKHGGTHLALIAHQVSRD